MQAKELKAELEKRLTDIKQKIQEVQNGIDEEDAPSVELEDILIRLKALQEDLILQHDQLVAMEEEGEEFNELERNIWTNIDSFDTAFSEAGGLIKPSKFKSRDRSVDFKNPTGTK
ncbi:MAG: hypothetical protein ACOCWD_05575 [Tangfeifania sp.]